MRIPPLVVETNSSSGLADRHRYQSDSLERFGLGRYSCAGPTTTGGALRSDNTVIQTQMEEASHGGDADSLKEKLFVESIRRRTHRQRIRAIKVAARRVSQLQTYEKGILPPEFCQRVRARARAAEITQDEVAAAVGISRPQLTNALQGRSGLSVVSAERLMAWLAHPPPVRQMALF